ncbi:hypothetical protein [Azohydromonas aeria]|uniref:hypothetical protein n=1 Tax=Azohydromonas aeria TaxID=2590212 RepID=UPI0012FAA4F2|nr:hypothetical protein [Azohydromonas aeria]
MELIINVGHALSAVGCKLFTLLMLKAICNTVITELVLGRRLPRLDAAAPVQHGEACGRPA